LQPDAAEYYDGLSVREVMQARRKILDATSSPRACGGSPLWPRQAAQLVRPS